MCDYKQWTADQYKTHVMGDWGNWAADIKPSSGLDTYWTQALMRLRALSRMIQPGQLEEYLSTERDKRIVLIAPQRLWSSIATKLIQKGIPVHSVKLGEGHIKLLKHNRIFLIAPYDHGRLTGFMPDAFMITEPDDYEIFKTEVAQDVHIEMYRIKLKDHITTVVCDYCYKYGEVYNLCTRCGGKGTHRRTREEWVVSPTVVDVVKIDRDGEGTLRYWENKSELYRETSRLLHFTKKDAQAECDARNKVRENRRKAGLV